MVRLSHQEWRPKLSSAASRASETLQEGRRRVFSSGKALELIGLVALLALAVVVRRPGLGDGERIWLDEVITLLSAEGILDDGLPILPSGLLNRFGFLHFYVVALTHLGTGVSYEHAQAVSFGFGVLIVAAVYFLGRSVGGPYVGFGGAVLAAFSEWGIFWSVQVRFYSLLQLLLIGALVSFFQVLRSCDQGSAFGKRGWWLLCIGFFILAILTHPLALVFISATALGILVVYPEMLPIQPAIRFMGKNRLWTLVALMGSVALLVLIGWFLDAQRLFYLARRDGLGFDLPFYIELLWDRTGPVFALASAGVLLGLLRRSKAPVFLGLVLTTSVLLISFYRFPGDRYAYFFAPPLLFVLATYFLWTGVQVLWQERYRRMAIPTILLLTVLLALVLGRSSRAALVGNDADFGNSAVWHSVAKVPYREPFLYLRERLESDDLVMLAMIGSAPAAYYLDDSFDSDKVYVLSSATGDLVAPQFASYEFRRWSYRSDAGFRDSWGGALIVSRPEEFNALIEDVRASGANLWVVVLNSRSVIVHEAIMDFIQSSLVMHEEASNEAVRVFSLLQDRELR